jgi:hypothetical protein
MARNKQIKIDVPNERSSNGGSFGKIAGAVLAGVALVFGFNYFANKQNAQEAGAAIQNDVYSQWASQIKNLIDGWTSDADIKEIIRIGGQITDFAKVSAAYSKLTAGAVLTADLSDAMGLEEYRNFVIALNAKGAAVNDKKVSVDTGTTPSGYVIGRTKLKFNTAKYGIGLYKTLADYGSGKVNLTIAKGSNPAAVTYLGAFVATYTSMQPPLKVPVYKIALANGSQYYVGRSLISGLAGLGGGFNIQ